MSSPPMNRFSEHAGERAQTQAEWSTRNREYVAVISGCSSLLTTRSHLNHNGSVRQRFSGREAKSQSADRRAGSRKGKESATLASRIKGNCGQFPYWTLFGTHYRCRNRWRVFLANYGEAIAALDFFAVPTISFGVLYCFFVISHDRVVSENRTALICKRTATGRALPVIRRKLHPRLKSPGLVTLLQA